MTTRFVVTHINKQGQRVLTRPNQARAHFDKRSKANRWLIDFDMNNAESDIIQVFGKQAIGTFEVTEAECYDNGDCTRTIF
jgi:hypothetical protein